mmetsp:Transcript_79114/g.219870  ORF Transcript_79114/g.219870 Transcript_79114/m.219870 type:complete len:236 (-) Transcript_79114:26-733(-)
MPRPRVACPGRQTSSGLAGSLRHHGARHRRLCPTCRILSKAADTSHRQVILRPSTFADIPTPWSLRRGPSGSSATLEDMMGRAARPPTARQWPHRRRILGVPTIWILGHLMKAEIGAIRRRAEVTILAGQHRRQIPTLSAMWRTRGKARGHGARMTAVAMVTQTEMRPRVSSSRSRVSRSFSIALGIVAAFGPTPISCLSGPNRGRESLGAVTAVLIAPAGGTTTRHSVDERMDL